MSGRSDQLKDIKTKEQDRNPKVRNPVSRLPKELVRSSVLNAKEKSAMLSDHVGRDTGQESPTEYAGNRLESAEYRVGSETASAVVQGGKQLAVKTYEKVQERKIEKDVVQNMRTVVSESSGVVVNPMKGESADKVLPTQRGIWLKPEGGAVPDASKKRFVKHAPRVVKGTFSSAEKVKTQTAMQKRQAVKSMKRAKETAQKSMQTAKQTVQKGKTVVRGAKALGESVVVAEKITFAAIMAGGSAAVVVLIIIVGIIAGAAFIGSSQSAESLSEEVLAYTSTIRRYANEFGISEYVSSIQAIMMQESGGRGTDPMQASECPYNTEYPNSPGAIQDPEYSIKVGIQYYADCVRQAECERPQDIEKLKLSWQGYNYGKGYITWAIRDHGGYSAENALQFSQEQAAAHGWTSYGDPEYVPHVMRYYSGGGFWFAGLFGNEQLVTVAKSQLGNEGGEKFWSWYGFNSRQEWCACFVSWCADQVGLIESGAVPRFAYCPTGIEWFKSHGKWQEAGSIPTPGTIIFFDWEQDGISDHVGIVESCDGTTIYTVEGNSDDAVEQKSYEANSLVIVGYGLLED